MNFLRCAVLLLSVVCRLPADSLPASLPGTTPLDWQGDLAARMVGGIDRDLDRRTLLAESHRRDFWKVDVTSNAKLLDSLLSIAETNRIRLRELLGVIDPRSTPSMRFISAAGSAMPA